ncbi:outer membrane protein assembly factor BamA [Coxiella endosymbiont of Amblyomma sculptum]|uniref:outer membrane protein assembly factor BamA n=1 Tax=Coxiella endosymbiont of Amblyomma sculptum TaxID=2487929 RepID=UPI001FE7BDB3|nr:outer membrane protein assembly factor BamA [Coxiella endosymbiont of Amblyomma sculptum]
MIALIVFWIVPLNLEAHDFVVHSIRIQGLKRISENTVYQHLPIHKGQQYSSQRGRAIIAALYKTGCFDGIRLSNCDRVLLIRVRERPTISSIHLSGKAVSNKKFRVILCRLGIVEGRTFNPFKLKQIERGLKQQYDFMGYTINVFTDVVRKSGNRVELYIKSENPKIVKICSVRFVGNHSFSGTILCKQFKPVTPSIFRSLKSMWTGNYIDCYSKTRLAQDLDNLIVFYLNHGYLRFRIISYDVRRLLNKDGVFITIYVDEGPVYRIKDCRINGKDYGIRNRLYRKLITVKSGDVFSRQNIIDTARAVSNSLKDRGYAFAQVSVVSTIEDQKHLVHLNFKIIPGQRVYVRRIGFLGNRHTNRKVLHQEMRQYEGSVYSLSRIEQSKRRLESLGYLSSITYTVQPISNSSNQVDLCYHVKEKSSGRISIQGGYSNLYGFLYGASVSEPNFLGTGKYIALGMQNNQFQRNFSFIYNNPYYTIWGLQQGLSIYYSHVSPDKKFNFSSYLEEGYGADINYSYPISEYNSIAFGYGLEHIAIRDVDATSAAPSVLSFLGVNNGIQNTSAEFNQAKLTANWVYNRLDRFVLPTAGFYIGSDFEMDIPFFKSSADYYLATSTIKYYRPLTGRCDGFIVNVLAILGYGSGFGHDRLPFFKNFFSGGIGSVPAFAPNSLGPKNRYPLGREYNAIGGNLETILGVHLILPQFLSQNIRTAIVFDAGNVFQIPRCPEDIAIPAHGGTSDPESNIQPQIVQDDRFSLRNFRPSLGFSVEWYTPLAPIDFTLAFPLNIRSGDHFQAFQFSFGMIL